MCGNRLCDDQLCRCVIKENVKTSVREIQNNHSNALNVEEEEKQSLYGTRRQKESDATNPRVGVSLIKNSHPGNRNDSCTPCEVRLYSWTVSTLIDQSLASNCNALTRTSELTVRQFMVAIYAWLSLRDTSSMRAFNSEEFGVFNILFLCTSHHLTS